MSIFQSRPSHWCNYKCDTNQDHVICQKIMPIETTEQKANRSNEINETQTELSTGENSCDIGWTLNENYCYKFFETNQTWSYANTMCLKNNAYLLTVNSESEQMFVQNYLFTISGALEAVWLGISEFFDYFIFISQILINLFSPKHHLYLLILIELFFTF